MLEAPAIARDHEGGDLLEVLGLLAAGLVASQIEAGGGELDGAQCVVRRGVAVQVPFIAVDGERAGRAERDDRRVAGSVSA
ncbi:MAG: hypothetical protein U5R31_11715 [Acidimicrobiia bacterium]|nr:hypothetical protein [Acidimicrobiia bacterium]